MYNGHHDQVVLELGCQNKGHSFLNYSFGNSRAFYYSIHLVNIRGSRVVEMREARVHDWGVSAGFWGETVGPGGTFVLLSPMEAEAALL